MERKRVSFFSFFPPSSPLQKKKEKQTILALAPEAAKPLFEISMSSLPESTQNPLDPFPPPWRVAERELVHASSVGSLENSFGFLGLLLFLPPPPPLLLLLLPVSLPKKEAKVEGGAAAGAGLRDREKVEDDDDDKGAALSFFFVPPPPPPPPPRALAALLYPETSLKDPATSAFGSICSLRGLIEILTEEAGRWPPMSDDDRGHSVTLTASSSRSFTAPASSGLTLDSTPTTSAGVRSKAARAGSRSRKPVVVHQPEAWTPPWRASRRSAKGRSGRQRGIGAVVVRRCRPFLLRPLPP